MQRVDPICALRTSGGVPVLQRRFADTEVGGDLFDGDAALAAASDSDDVLAELSGIGTGHDDILPASASRH